VQVAQGEAFAGYGQSKPYRPCDSRLPDSGSTEFREGLMTDTKDVNVEVRGEDVIITAPGTDYLVIYCKRENS
jgi:hypothetical protein